MLIDRIIFVCWPLYAPTVCTVFMAKLLTIFVYIGLLTVSIHALWTYEVTVYGECNIDRLQRDFQTVVWPWIAATLYSYLPLLLILVLLVLLSLGVAADCSSRQMQPDSVTVSPNRFICLTTTVSCVFLLLTLPSIITNFIQYANPFWLHSHANYARMYMVSELFQMLTCLNYAGCHVIYFACTPQLRKDLFTMLLQCRCKRQHFTHNSVANSIEVNGMLLSPNGMSINTASTSLWHEETQGLWDSPPCTRKKHHNQTSEVWYLEDTMAQYRSTLWLSWKCGHNMVSKDCEIFLLLPERNNAPRLVKGD